MEPFGATVQPAGTAPAPAVEALPDVAPVVFGAESVLAQRYAGFLVDAGVVRGLIGPREPGRIWTRHLLNCAVVTELFAVGARVVDVGSGAGLPGVAMAIRRPDLRVDLVEPMQRRVDFLLEVVDSLGIGDRVRVVRGRADDPAVRDVVGGADWVTARAVAPLDRLVGWCLPLLGPSGQLALLRGASAEDELRSARPTLARLRATSPTIVTCGNGVVEPAVPVLTAGAAPARVARRGKR